MKLRGAGNVARDEECAMSGAIVWKGAYNYEMGHASQGPPN